MSGPEPDPRLGLIWEEGQRAVDGQVCGLDELRSRAAMVLTAASIAAAFLAATALDGGANFRTATWFGTGAFAVVGILTTAVLVPVRGWKFHRGTGKLLASYVEGENPSTIDDMHHDLAYHLQYDLNVNEKKLRWCYWALSASCAALVVEILAFLWDLRGRR